MTIPGGRQPARENWMPGTLLDPQENTQHPHMNTLAASVAQWMEGLWASLRQSARSLRRSPVLVVVSTLSLGLGFGVNTVLYMAISKVYGHEPTMTDPQHVVGVEMGNANQFSYPDYQDLLHSNTFGAALGFRTAIFNLGAKGRLRRVGAMVVTGNFFDVLGVHAALGRTFSAIDGPPEKEPRVVVVTSGFWRANLGGDRTAVGESLVLNGERFTVIGVLADGYQGVMGWRDVPIYMPLSKFALPTMDEREAPSLTVLARLAPNVPAQQAAQAVSALSASLERTYPNRLPSMGRPASVFPVSALQFRGSSAQLLLMAIVWATAISVLLISCVNVTGLLLARATDRRSEMAIRAALGASRVRIAQTMLAECFLLVAIGAAVGLVLAWALNRIPFPGSMMAVRDALALDSRIVPYAVVLIGVMTMVCGVIPALRTTRVDIQSELSQGGRSVTPRMWLREMLVAGQVVMSFILIVTALLCVRSQIRIAHANLGFDIDHGIVAGFGLQRNQYPDQARVRLAEKLVKRIEQIPGVVSVSYADLVPLSGNAMVNSFHPAGRTDIPGTRPDTFSVGPGFFRTLGIPLLKGRDFAQFDRLGSTRVAIINETFARTYFSGPGVVDQLVETAGEPAARIIGMVHDHRINTIGEAPRSVIYYAYSQRPSDLFVHVRIAVAPSSFLSAVQRAVDETDQTMPVTVQTLQNATSLELTMRRLGMILMGALGGVALVLAAIGLYGVMAYVAASRTADAAIRMAIGASPNRILWDILRRALMVVIPSVALGALASLLMTPALSTFLAGVSPFDPLAFGGSAALLLLTGLAASYVPARRNSRLDPIQALRRQ
jgi:predicted permease